MTVASLEQQHAIATGADLDRIWSRFADSTGSSDFPRLWLSLLCAQISVAHSALLLLGNPDRGPFTTAAVWPEPTRDLTHLTPAAERTLRERRGLALRRDVAGVAMLDLSYPLLLDDVLHGALMLEMPDAAPELVQQVLRQVHWGISGLELELTRRVRQSDEAARQRVFSLLDLVSVVVEEQRFQGAASTLVSELANRLDCDRVSLGLRKGQQMRVAAVSHSASFGRQMNLIRLIEAAMDEAVDQEARVWFPSEDESCITTAHAALAQQQGAAELCTVPINVQGGYQAALTIERPAGRSLAPIEADFCETLGELAAPMLLCRREEERWLALKALDAGRNQLQRLFGPRYLGRKLVALLVAALVAFFSVATGQYRIIARAELEGGELRVMAAPFNGYIATAEVRAGEQVAAGDLLATLDDRDLTLEQVKLSTERAQTLRERREAAAEHERATVRILTAQLEQADAQIRLVKEQLERTRIRAPFDAIVVSGDLSQSLGAPVQQGEQLFELTPRGSWRIRLAVPEPDIDDVEVGQTGTLLLSALPEQSLPIDLTLITPVVEVIDGQSTFSVEAEFGEGADSAGALPQALRPGMAGVGKIDVGERRLIWIWTRGFLQWVRLKLWSWWP